jgi:hypothetical protein
MAQQPPSAGEYIDADGRQHGHNSGVTASVESPGRPFVWSEIHYKLKERIAQLDETIRAEIGRPNTAVPKYGAERRQFFLLLEERANGWADRVRDLHECCLKEIGREGHPTARSSVYNDSLSFFLHNELRHFLFLECGCVVDRRYTIRKPGQPRPIQPWRFRMTCADCWRR